MLINIVLSVLFVLSVVSYGFVIKYQIDFKYESRKMFVSNYQLAVVDQKKAAAYSATAVFFTAFLAVIFLSQNLI